MKKYKQKRAQLKIIIYLSGIQELQDYKNGILGILKEIEINGITEKMQNNLKSVYRLLNHLALKDRFEIQIPENHDLND